MKYETCELCGFSSLVLDNGTLDCVCDRCGWCKGQGTALGVTCANCDGHGKLYREYGRPAA